MSTIATNEKDTHNMSNSTNSKNLSAAEQFLADMQAIASDTSPRVTTKRDEGNVAEWITETLDAFYASGEQQLVIEDADLIGVTVYRKKADADRQPTIAEAFNRLRDRVNADSRPFGIVKAGDSVILLNPLAGEDAMKMVADEVRRLTSLRNHNLGLAQDEKRTTKERKAAAANAAKHDRALNDLLARIAGNIQ